VKPIQPGISPWAPGQQDIGVVAINLEWFVAAISNSREACTGRSPAAVRQWLLRINAPTCISSLSAVG
jgi:hypothetical protein